MNRRRFIQSAALAAAALPASLDFAASASEPVRLDSDGMLIVGGKREFPLGLYQLPKRPAAMREARDAGFNLLRLSATRDAYDEAHALGLRGWSGLGSLPAEKPEEAESGIRKHVGALRDHPALLCWETEDEPSYVWKEPTKVRIPPERINATAALIRKLDPAHPLYLNHSPTNLVSTLQAYNPASDIVAMDIYPVIPHGIRPGYALWKDGRQGDFSNASISQVGQYTDKMRAVAGPGRALFMVLQAFAWEQLREKDRDPKMVLYPTAAQLRFMALQSIAHGANGLIWWGLGYEAPEATLWDDLRKVVAELAEIREALAAPPVALNLDLEYHDTGHSLDRGIEWIAKPFGKDTLLIAVNADGNPVDVTIKGLEGFRGCELMFDKGDVAWSNGALSASFVPFGTRIWRLRPA